MDEKELIISLLQKPEFKKWVLDPTEESNHYWEKWIAKHPDEKDAALKAREIILRLRFRQGSLSEAAADDLLTAIVAKERGIAKTREYDLSIRRKKQRLLRYAAVITFAVLSGLTYMMVRDVPQEPQIQEMKAIVRSNPQGQRSVIHLSDGTAVHLNANSTLTYFENYELQRVVELEGEAPDP